MMPYTRRLLLQNLYNARDLGGFATKDGKRTRFGVFVRSEAPCGLPQEDIDALLGYGLTMSIDLRSTPEVHSRPSSLAGAAVYHHKPLFDEAAVVGEEKSKATIKPHGGNFDWGKQYCEMAEDSREWAVETLSVAAAGEGLVLYHCTTGKDRTGLLTCYLLSIAGVSREDIAADYCVSEVYLQPVYRMIRSTFGAGMPEDDPFFRTPASSMLTLIDYLTDTYGGVCEYLRKIGVPETVIETIRAKLVEP